MQTAREKRIAQRWRLALVAWAIFTVVMISLVGYASVSSARDGKLKRLQDQLTNYCLEVAAPDACIDWPAAQLSAHESAIEACAFRSAEPFGDCLAAGGIEPPN